MRPMWQLCTPGSAALLAGERHRERRRRLEAHESDRTGRLRAAVLGSNDAIVPVSSLTTGVGAGRRIDACERHDTVV
jgi:hypothetical protein